MGVGRIGLFSQAKLAYELTVLVSILALQIVEQLAPMADKGEQTAPRMVILDVGLEVTGEAVDARRQQRHLHFRRSGVALGALMVRDDLRLLRNRNWHSNSLRRKARYFKANSTGSTRASGRGANATMASGDRQDAFGVRSP